MLTILVLRFSFFFNNLSTSNAIILSFSSFSCIVSLPLLSSSSINSSCIDTLSFKLSFFNSKVLTESLTTLSLSLTMLFIAENILMSRRSSMTSLRLGPLSCMNGMKLLLPRITICVNDLKFNFSICSSRTF